MKGIYILLILFLTNFCVVAQDTGIQFDEGNWDEILALAKRVNKPIFFDAYTSWCGPCKSLARDVFTDKSVGEFYNKNFVNVHFDMEKGDGLMLAERYAVKVYPTLLFIDTDGKILHRSAGFLPTDRFVELGKIALNPTERLSASEERFAKGDRDSTFLYNYSILRYKAMDDSHLPVVKAYLDTQSDWANPQTMEYILQFTSDTDTDMFRYMVQNRAKFENEFGKDYISQRINMLVENKLNNPKSLKNIKEADDLLYLLYPDRAARLSANYRMSYHRQLGDRDAYAKAAVDYFKKYNDNADELNEAAQTFYEAISSKKMLKKAVSFAKQSIKLNDNYYNNLTLALLYKKINKKSKAIAIAEKAIAIAKKNEEDSQEAKDLLDELNKK